MKCGDSVCEGLNGCEGVRCQGVDLMVCGLVGVDWWVGIGECGLVCLGEWSSSGRMIVAFNIGRIKSLVMNRGLSRIK